MDIRTLNKLDPDAHTSERILGWKQNSPALGGGNKENLFNAKHLGKTHDS